VELVKQAKLESFYYAVVNGRDTSRPYGYGRRNHHSYLCVICVDLRFLEYEHFGIVSQKKMKKVLESSLFYRNFAANKKL